MYQKLLQIEGQHKSALAIATIIKIKTFIWKQNSIKYVCYESDLAIFQNRLKDDSWNQTSFTGE